MTPCPSLPAQPQWVSTLFSCTFHFSISLLTSSMSITTCTTTGGKYSIFIYILFYTLYISAYIPVTPCPSLPAQPQTVSTLFSCTFYFTCTLYISPYIPMTPCPSLPAQPQRVSTLFSCTFYFTCTLYISPYIPMTPCPSLPAQPQRVSTLFSCTFYFTCTLYISPYIPHDTLSITTCTTTGGKYSIFMYILFYMYIVYLSLHSP